MQQFDYRTMMMNLPSIVYWRDLENRILGGNIACAKLAGCSNVEHLIGLSDFDAPWAKYAANYLQHDQDTSSGLIYKQIDPVKTGKGEFKFLLANKSVLYDAEGNFSAVLGISVELTNSDIINLSRFIYQSAPYLIDKSIVFSNENYIQAKTKREKLTTRELECLFFIMRGASYKKIARILDLSSRTVETYVENIKHKFKCHSKSELIDLSYNLGLGYFIPESIIFKNISKNINNL